jgi:hypothetical protein
MCLLNEFVPPPIMRISRAAYQAGAMVSLAVMLNKAIVAARLRRGDFPHPFYMTKPKLAGNLVGDRYGCLGLIHIEPPVPLKLCPHLEGFCLNLLLNGRRWGIPGQLAAVPQHPP